MNKTQSGLVLIGAGIVLNLLGRVIMPYVRSQPNVTLAGLMAIWMLASVVLVLFGLFRVIVGVTTKNRPDAGIESTGKTSDSNEPPIPMP